MECSRVALGKHGEGKREKRRPCETWRPRVQSLGGILIACGSGLNLLWGGGYHFGGNVEFNCVMQWYILTR